MALAYNNFQLKLDVNTRFQTIKTKYIDKNNMPIFLGKIGISIVNEKRIWNYCFD